jgi:hypothetical protein
MLRHYSFLTVSFAVLLVFGQISAQVVRNPKLSPKDLDAAQSITKEAGGATAELIYTTRIDAIQRGSFDSLVVIYAKASKGSKDYYALVARDGKNYPLVFDKQGRALKAGDKFLRMGLKHEEGKPPLLRLMGAFINTDKSEMQRNLDFQFSGNGFALVDQSTSLLAR